jgi:hypothetical protein
MQEKYSSLMLQKVERVVTLEFYKNKEKRLGNRS